MTDQTRKITVDTTGGLVWEFNTVNLSSLQMYVDANCFWGLAGIDMAITPLAAGATLVIDWAAFPPEVRQRGKRVLVYVKSKAGNTNCYVNFLGVS